MATAAMMPAPPMTIMVPLGGAVALLSCTAAVRCALAEPVPEHEPAALPVAVQGDTPVASGGGDGSGSSSAPSAARANLVLSVVHTHVRRVLEYLQEETEGGAAPLLQGMGLEMLGVPPGCSAKQKKGKSWSDLPIALRAFGGAAGAAAAAAALIADPILSCAIRKTFVVEPAVDNAAMLSSIEAAAAALLRQLDSAAADVRAGAKSKDVAMTAPVGVRVQAYPASVLPRLLEALHSLLQQQCAADDTTTTSPRQWILSPQAVSGCAGLVASVVQLPVIAPAHPGGRTSAGSGSGSGGGGGDYRAGVCSLDGYAGLSRQSRAAHPDGDGEAVCRAYYKLQEAVQRGMGTGGMAGGMDAAAGGGGGGGVFEFEGAVAIDAGAAPGGWTKYLACDRKCRKVFAVDPAELQLQGQGQGEEIHVEGDKGERQQLLPSNVQHMRW